MVGEQEVQRLGGVSGGRVPRERRADEKSLLSESQGPEGDPPPGLTYQ